MNYEHPPGCQHPYPSLEIFVPDQIFAFTDQKAAVQAMIQPYQKPVLLVSNRCTAEELQYYAGVIRFGIKNQWMVREIGTNKMPPPNIPIPFSESAYEPDKPLWIPQVRVGPGLSKEFDRIKLELAYMLVVQGRSGGLRSKLRIEYSLFEAVVALFHEAVNGYSVVFVGAVLQVDLPHLKFCNLKQADSVDRLKDMRATCYTEGLGIIC